MGYIWNKDQLAALEALNLWWKEPIEPFILQGYAGTGKTTVVREMIERLNVTEPTLLAPTGKAAKVMQDRSGYKAQTIHSFIYTPADVEAQNLQARLTTIHETLDRMSIPNTDEEFEETEGQLLQEIERIKDRLHELSLNDAKFVKKLIRRPPRLIVCDEASMVDEYIGADLEELQVPLIYIGDPFQLPPVKNRPVWHNRRANSILTKIERQGEGSGIVYAAQEVRMGGLPIAGSGFNIHRRGSYPLSNYLDADLVLVGTNKLRRELNNKIRALLGYHTPYPVAGEKLICISNDKETNIKNGEIFTVEKVFFDGAKQMGLTLIDAFDTRINVKCWKELFENDENGKFVPRGFVHLTFAYAITVHKSQGSEGKKVVLLDSWPGKMWDRWTYTGITRAQENCEYISSQQYS